jgi:hypothetical protein
MILSPTIRQKFTNSNGVPLSGGKLYSYVAGTTTPLVTYSNSTGTTNTNPVILDSSGEANVWLDPALSYKFKLTDSADVVQWTVDNVTSPAATGVPAWNANVTYSQGQIVQDASGEGVLYVSLTNNNVGNALTSVANWRVHGGRVRTISTSGSATVTDDVVLSNSTSGAVTVTLPACSTTAIGKKITVKDVGTGGNTTSVKGAGSDTVDGANTYAIAQSANSAITVINTGSAWNVVTGAALADGAVTGAKLASAIVDNSTIEKSSNVLRVKDGGITQAKRAALPYQTSAIAASSSLTVGASATLGSVTITTTGRPVLILFAATGSPANPWLTAGSANIAFVIDRDGTDIGKHYSFAVPQSGIFVFDPTPTAASHTYTFRVTNGVGTNSYAANGVLVAIEL